VIDDRGHCPRPARAEKNAANWPVTVIDKTIEGKLLFQ